MNQKLQLAYQYAANAFQAGNLGEAEKVLKNLALSELTNFDSIHLLAIVYASQGKHDVAIQHYKKAIKLKPNDISALSNLGSSLNVIGKNNEAFRVLGKAIALDPQDSEILYNLGNVLSDLGDYEGAIHRYEQVIKLNPSYFQAYLNLGKAFYELSRAAEALENYEKALNLNPNLSEAWSNKGAALSKLMRFDEALLHFDRALSLKPDYAEGWSNKGLALNGLKRFDEALLHFDRALSLKPDYAEGWSNKGLALNGLKRFDEALEHHDKALSLKSNIDWIYSIFLYVKMKICSWSGLEGSLQNVSRKVMLDQGLIDPFVLVALIDDPLLHKKSSEIYIRSAHPFNPVLGPIHKHPKNQKIRLGYFSVDFKNHPTATLVAELFEIHDRNQFDIYAFSLERANDEMRGRLHKAFDYFIDVDTKSDAEIAQMARNLEIDIAIDLTGFTQDSRLGIFAYRAAPIQVNYLGYPGTMGADYMDYIIADKTLIPVESQAFYSEKVVYLPNSYQANDRKRLISDRLFTRKELELPENEFVFCCFNNNFKILPSTFSGWMRILKAVEGSVLWLLQDNPWVVDNLKKEAQIQGVDGQRLIFANRMSTSEHLARHRQANLFLDTLPYNAHTTTSDALWTGLPVLTLMGRSFASRVAGSLLSAVGLPELIAHTQEEYETLAIELARNPQKLADIKLRLANNCLNTPLFDTPLYTKHLEMVYIQMMEKYQAGLPFDHIYI